MTNFTLPPAELVEHFGDSVSREWYCGQRLVVFTVTGFSRVVADEWFDATADAMRGWPQDRPYCSIHDFIDQKVGYSPYSSAKAKALLQLGKALRVRGPLAIALSNTMVHRLMSNMLLRSATRKLQMKFFFSRQSAFEWMMPFVIAGEGNQAEATTQ